MNRLVLIDGNAVMHRAYHALPPLRAPDGRPAHIVYGFVSMIIKIFRDLKPTHMTVAFDRPGPTFREKLFPAYQSQRPKMEDDFIGQISLVHEAVAALGIPIFECDGFEADDVIGTICRQAIQTAVGQVIILTGDRDILQLVKDEKVLVFMPTKGLSEGKLYGKKEVSERMGVIPEHITDLKALMGDASDNYPGVVGIGPKTAISLVTRYGSVEALYKKIPSLSNKYSSNIIEKIKTGKQSALLSKNLATIRTDAPITFSAKAARITTLDTLQIRHVLETLHFPSLLKRLIGDVESVKKQEAHGDGKTQRKVDGKTEQQQALF